MSPDPQFERDFRDWVENRRMSWERLTLPIGSGYEPTTAYRLTPDRTPTRVVVALHGAGNDALFAWVGLFKRLLLGGAQVITFDLPGHGRFNRGPFGALAGIAAVGAAIDLCEHESASLPVHGIGVSLGGSVLLGSLPSIQSRLASAMLLVAPLEIRFSLRSVAGEFRPATAALLWRERRDYGLTGLIPSFGPFKRDVYPLRLDQSDETAPFAYVTTINGILRGMDLEMAARAVALPTLLIYGGRDRVVPPEQGLRLKERLRGADFRLVKRGTHLSTPLAPETMDWLETWMSVHG